VVFHSAASVKFHGPLKDFIAQNVCGTQSVMQLSEQMPKLQVCFIRNIFYYFNYNLILIL
jgi:thioester reductase-like protein